MKASRAINLPDFRVIREAVLSAPPRPAGFPFHALKPEGIAALRAAPVLKRFWTEVQTESTRAINTPVPALSFGLFSLFETSGDRLAYETPYFNRRRRLASLALAALIEPEEACLKALADILWEICNEYTWALPAHLPLGMEAVQAYRLAPPQVVDLFAAETAQALAEVLALHGKSLPRWMEYRVRTEVERRIFQPLFNDPRRFKWESEPMNWAAVCGGCAGMAALVLEDDRERLAGMLDRVLRALEVFLSGFGEDGGCAEGIAYWEYGFGYFAYFAEMLADFTGGQLNLLDLPLARRIAGFPQVVSLGADTFVNYSDADEQCSIHPGLGSRLSQRLGQSISGLKEPSFYTDAIFRWAHLSRDVFWTHPEALHAPVIEGSYELPELNWLVEKKIWDGKILAFSAKGGHNAEPHNHNDLGHFILHVGGENLLADLGAGVYTRQYFGPQRYEELHTNSLGHSVPLINGLGQQAGRECEARVLRCERQPDETLYSLDLTAAYPGADLEKLVRTFTWAVDATTLRAELNLKDCFQFHLAPTALEEIFISQHSPLVNGNTLTWKGSGGSVQMTFDANAFEPAVEVLDTHNHQSIPVRVYRLRLRAKEALLRREENFHFVCQLARRLED